jgi:hypothetical protein
MPALGKTFRRIFESRTDLTQRRQGAKDDGHQKNVPKKDAGEGLPEQ